jgi:ADP-ribose pyrophosphatase YjhB (NUDIX family)
MADDPASAHPSDYVARRLGEQIDGLDLAREYMRAFNRADRDALIAAYQPDARTEQLLPTSAGDERVDGRAAIADSLSRFFDTYEGGFSGGTFFDVRTIARIEGGGVHVEWLSRVRHRASGERTAYTGYFHFVIEQRLIRHQRGVAHVVTETRGDAAAASEEEAATETTRPSRVYPARPIVGVGGVIVMDGKVVLIKRRFEPLAGQWSLPGGSLEVGETLEAGVAREMLEETGLHVDVGPVVDVFDRILLDGEHKVRYHFVLIDYLCTPRGGDLRAASDVADVALVAPEDLGPYRLTPKADAVIRKALALWRPQPSFD